jgi:hypothetical protein
MKKMRIESDLKKGALEQFVIKSGVLPVLQPTNVSNVSGILDNPTTTMMQTKAGPIKVLHTALSKAPISITPGSTPPRKTDGEIVDEQLQGHEVAYQLFFLTSYVDSAGSEGPFYVQLEGSYGTTGLHVFWPFTDPGQWKLVSFLDTYVGKISKIRVAAGTGNGFYFSFLVLLYARGYVWVVGPSWVQTDEISVIEMDID